MQDKEKTINIYLKYASFFADFYNYFYKQPNYNKSKFSRITKE
jgi:hypothetical protein